MGFFLPPRLHEKKKETLKQIIELEKIQEIQRLWSLFFFRIV